MKQNILKRMGALLMIGLLSAFMMGCGKEAGKGAETKTAQKSTAEATGDEAELREMNVVLDWYPNALHTFLYTAIERGYYEEEGLKVNICFPANENDAITMVAAGKAEIGLYYQHDAIQAVADQNVKIKSIGAVVQSPLNIILSLKDKNINSPADFVGKTIGYGGTALSEGFIKTMMETAGVDSNDVELVNVGFDLMSSMTTGNVDATIGCLVNHEVPEMEEEGFEVNYFTFDKYGVPTFYEELFLANDEMIEKEPETLKAFLRASAKGYEDFKQDPAGTLAILLSNQSEENFPLSESVETKSCEVLLPLMETEEVPFLGQDPACWQENIDWMLDAGLIQNKVEVDDVMVNLMD